MRPIDVVRRIAPHANTTYLQAIERGDRACPINYETHRNGA